MVVELRLREMDQHGGLTVVKTRFITSEAWWLKQW